MNVPWLPRLHSHLERLRGSGVVVAVSGGGDSVGLLRVLQASATGFGLRLSVAHLDHGTRGEEGRGDARFVADLASSLGLPFDLGHWRASRPNHFEADARRGRYEWLAGVARARGARHVAVGQTLDDQAETVLHRVVRGTGLRGLAGMPSRRRLEPGVVLVRPLLGVSRIEVRDYLEAIGQRFREDSTNLDTSRTRARIRLELLPEPGRNVQPERGRGAGPAGPDRLGIEPDARAAGGRAIGASPARIQARPACPRPPSAVEAAEGRTNRGAPTGLATRRMAGRSDGRQSLAAAVGPGVVEAFGRRGGRGGVDGRSLDLMPND